MKNADYWRKRAEAVEEQAHQSAAAFLETATEEFDKASVRLQREIADWYRRFADNNGITLVEAKRLLNTKELKEFRWTVEDYIQAASQLDPEQLDKAVLKQLENASARVHISRLEALQLQLQAETELLYGNHTDDLTAHLSQIYEEGYYRTAFTIQQGMEIGWSLAKLNENAIRKALSEPWTADNNTFRDKCWTQKKQLSEALRTQLTQGIIRGDNPMQMADVIAKQFNVSKNKAARLCYTESAHISALSQRDCYQELQVERFQIVETLDSLTCPTCGSLDGKVLPMSRYEVGVTVPPFHPNCRGCTCPYFADDVGQWVARDENGNTYYVPENTTFEEWKEKYIEQPKRMLYNIFRNDVLTELEDYSTSMHTGHQSKHIRGSNNFDESRSELTVDPQMLYDLYSKKGQFLRTNAGEWNHKERFIHSETIGVYKNQSDGREVNTSAGMIHYSKRKGWHIVPAKPRKGDTNK